MSIYTKKVRKKETLYKLDCRCVVLKNTVKPSALGFTVFFSYLGWIKNMMPSYMKI